MKRRSPWGVTLVGLGSVGIALGLLAFAAIAQGNVVKCVDANGNITYQDVPCTPGQAGRSVELPKAEAREDTSAWEAAARDARVVKGMPKRWVLRSRGAPAEIRPATINEKATEVWRYSAKDGALLVGFAGPDVAWVRDEAVSGGAAPSANGGDAATRGAQNRRFVIAGRFCEHVFAEIGVADREEPLASPANAAGAPAPAGTRYTYEPNAGDPQMRTVFSCVGGKVADVERTVVR
jgi:uncharacterized protein DUF4124